MPTESNDKTLSDKDISGLKNKLRQAKSAITKLLRTWELNRAFFVGDQWVF